MSKLSGQQTVCIDSGDFLKPTSRAPLKKSTSKSTSNAVPNISGSCGDLSQHGLKSSPSALSRDDSISSKSSSKSLFTNIMQSFDSSSGFSISQGFVPRTEKTLALFDIIISTLKDLKKKYSEYSHTAEGTESSEKGDMSSKVENRIKLVQALKGDYETLMKTKEGEVTNIKSTIMTTISSKSAKEELDMMDCESYWEVCREMCIVESKLERCAGKLQFQIMELDSVSRVSAFDQYELSIRLNDVSKFKTKIKIEKNGHQVWENTTFVLNPTVDDSLDVKFQELKTLNKSLVLLERKVPYVNNLILADPSIYTFWLTPVGTIKLKVIVQWNACIDDPDLMASFGQIDNKFHDLIVKDGVTIRKRPTSGMNKFSHNRLSVNFGSLFRSDGFDRTSPRGSMENIAERVEEEGISGVHLRKFSYNSQKDRVKAEYIEEPVQTEVTVVRDVAIEMKIPIIATEHTEDNNEEVIVETIVPSAVNELNCEMSSEQNIDQENVVDISAEDNINKESMKEVVCLDSVSDESKPEIHKSGAVMIREGEVCHDDVCKIDEPSVLIINDPCQLTLIEKMDVSKLEEDSNKCLESQLPKVALEDIAAIKMRTTEIEHIESYDSIANDLREEVSEYDKTTIELENKEIEQIKSYDVSANDLKEEIYENDKTTIELENKDINQIESYDSGAIDLKGELSEDDKTTINLGITEIVHIESHDEATKSKERVFEDNKATIESVKTEIVQIESYDSVVNDLREDVFDRESVDCGVVQMRDKVKEESGSVCIRTEESNEECQTVNSPGIDRQRHTSSPHPQISTSVDGINYQ